MAINFPDNPATNDTHNVGNTNYIWDGVKWTASVIGGVAFDNIQEGNSSVEVVDTGSDGRVVVNTEGVERLRIDENGNVNIDSGTVYVDAGNNRVGIGTSSPGYKLSVIHSDNNNVCQFYQGGAGSNTDVYWNNAGSANNFIISRRSNGESWFFNSGADPIAFYTNAQERLRITSDGNVGIGNTVPISSVHLGVTSTEGNARIAIQNSTVNTWHGFSNKNDSLAFERWDGSSWVERMRIDSGGNTILQTIGAYLRLNSASTNFDISGQPGGTDFIRINANNTQRFQFDAAGRAYNSTGTWGTISDVRLKENIVDASSKLEEVKRLRVVNYNLLSDPDVKQIGFVAQELEEVFPSLVEETGTVGGVENAKAVKTTVLVPVLVKALQEAIDKIETLEAKVAALESA